jgi:hypothetical protein
MSCHVELLIRCSDLSIKLADAGTMQAKLRCQLYYELLFTWCFIRCCVQVIPRRQSSKFKQLL